MEEEILKFFYQREIKGPLLLGLSGGPDSTLLFHLLVRSGLSFHAAHINHFWRPESSKEASLLEVLCKSYGVPFHLHELSIDSMERNLEDLCREARLAFFRKICLSHHLQGVVLGHHADDQAETVLKRVFEGANLAKLKGLAPITNIEKITLFRPLLNIRKDQIIKWLENNKLSFFVDSTNEDARFLRGRMRTELLPLLSEHFGKQVSPSLCRLGESALELHEFLEEVLKPYREHMKHLGDGSRALDFNPMLPQTSFLWKAVVRDFFDHQRVSLSSSVVQTIVFHLQRKSVLKNIRIGKGCIQVHHGILSFTKNPMK